MNGGGWWVGVDVGGNSYSCYCTTGGFNVFVHDGRRNRVVYDERYDPNMPADAVAAHLRAMEVAIVADAYGVDARVVEGMAR